MIKKLLFLFVIFGCSALYAQENGPALIKLTNGYSVKGEIIEQTDQMVKIKTLNGEIFEYKRDEISDISSTKANDFPKVLKKGDKIISLGIGFGAKITYSSSDFFTDADKITMPPIPVSFEYVIIDDVFKGKGAIGCGGFVGYSASKPEYYYVYDKVKNSRLIIGARGYVHYALMANLDTYAGVLLGYKSDKTKFTESTNPEYYPNEKVTDGSLTINAFAGCRYFFDEKFAGMAELGWGLSILTLGVSVKL